MDASRFDNFARSLASPSRRMMLRRLVSVTLGAILLPVLGDDATEAHDLLAKCKKLEGNKKKKCVKKAKKHNATHTTPPPTGGGSQPGDTDPCAGVQCTIDPPCGTNGTCANGVCQKYPAGTSCRPSSCTNGILTPAASCDGNGNCPSIPQQSCSTGLCNASGTACGPCGSDLQCGANRWCDSGTCRAKGANGAGCPVANACLSNFCVRGTCCNHPCVGNRASTLGTCPNGFCVLDCDGGWGDCDGLLDSGCETSLRTTENCGACENNCNDICEGGGTCGAAGACFCR